MVLDPELTSDLTDHPAPVLTTGHGAISAHAEHVLENIIAQIQLSDHEPVGFMGLIRM